MSATILKDTEAPPVPEPGRRQLKATPGTFLVWGGMALFLILLFGVVASVVVNSFAGQWFDSWFPSGYTTAWYGEAWQQYDLTQVVSTTVIVAVAVVGISVLIGAPASYVLARRSFPGKNIVMLVFLLPIMMPPITYGIPLATLLTYYHLAPGLTGVILANLVPSVPFVILTMTPFIEQINPSIESAARMCGANMTRLFTRILAPLLIPGVLAAAVLVLVRTVGMFELTFLTSNSSSDTLVVALFTAMTGAGIRAQQSVDAMAVIYMLMMMVLLVVALRFVNPTQLVSQVREDVD
ncbi:ABC transporter permease subunit [Arthrobacter sp. zg-Y411]|uniref:ABC transporter permease n=1 Tax=Arthrobacter TaxID=1663 RepID=UPI001D15783A|nr:MULTISPECIES: ABC transporter permease subunit [Arthrobacter]MCC3294990.1 ABC transporter permease subunit [Arthrobacter zhangbolii]MDN3903813.1 ABC transporter permease subunit [Arthrobacter sp. YD2]